MLARVHDSVVAQGRLSLQAAERLGLNDSGILGHHSDSHIAGVCQTQVGHLLLRFDDGICLQR